MYYNLVSILKDPIIAFSVVILFDIPILQIGIPLLIMCYFTYMEYKYNPILNKTEMFTSKVIKLAFTLVLFSYAILYLFQNKINPIQSNLYFGWVLLALYFIVITVNSLPFLNEISRVAKKICKRDVKGKVQKSVEIKKCSKEKKEIGKHEDLDESQDKNLLGFESKNTIIKA